MKPQTAQNPQSHELHHDISALTRQEELKMQEEFIARNGVGKMPAVAKETDFERLQRIREFKQELQEKYKKPEANVEGQRIWKSEEGKIGWVLLWAIGVPIPVLLILYLLRGCT